MTAVIEYLLANPLFLIPILLLVAMMVWAILKKLLKVAVGRGDRGCALRAARRVLRDRALERTPLEREHAGDVEADAPLVCLKLERRAA